MIVWVAFVVAVVFVAAGVWVAVDGVNEGVAAAEHEALLDDLWGELVEQDQVPPDVLAPIRAYAVWLRRTGAKPDDACPHGVTLGVYCRECDYDEAVAVDV